MSRCSRVQTVCPYVACRKIEQLPLTFQPFHPVRAYTHETISSPSHARSTMIEEPPVTPGLGRRAARGAAFMGAAQILKIFLTVASAIVLARLIPPDEYGVVAMAAPITSFILLFQDIGLSQAAV